jgi:ankyrin repeat protein
MGKYVRFMIICFFVFTTAMLLPTTAMAEGQELFAYVFIGLPFCFFLIALSALILLISKLVLSCFSGNRLDKITKGDVVAWIILSIVLITLFVFLFPMGQDTTMKPKEQVMPAYMTAREQQAELETNAAGLKSNAVEEKPSCITFIANVEFGSLESIKELLKAGADINCQEDGKSILILAVARPAEVIDVLLKAGADINEQDNNGWTALMIASYSNGRKDEIVKILLQAGARPDIKKPDGMTALHLACQDGSVETVKMLLDAGADPNIQGKDEYDFPILEAYTMGDLLRNEWKNQSNAEAKAADYDKIVGLLLNAGANPEIYASVFFDKSLLMAAASAGRKEVVEMLLKAKADPNRQNKNRDTAMSLAQDNGHHEIVDILRKAGAKTRYSKYF